jgi:hypothetical protein
MLREYQNRDDIATTLVKAVCCLACFVPVIAVPPEDVAPREAIDAYENLQTLPARVIHPHVPQNAGHRCRA